MISCSGEEPIMERENETVESTPGQTKHYLFVNLMSAGAPTRSSAQFQDGNPEENLVSKVRFYFFTEGGRPAAVKYNALTGTYLSFYDWYPTGQTATPDNGNTEKIVSAGIIIESGGESLDQLPYSVMAILNPTGLSDENLSVSELKNTISEYNASSLTSAGNFIMSNSIYIDEKNRLMDAIPVTGHIFETQYDALSNPIDIYVERVIAKLNLFVSMTPVLDLDGVYDTGIKYEIDDLADEKISYSGNIYLKLLGWNVTATPDKSRLVKEVNSGWSPLLFGSGSQPWNIPDYHRSFWALNPENIVFNYGNFGVALPDASNPDKLPFTPLGTVANANKNFGSLKEKAVRYLQENAAAFGDDRGFCEPSDNSKLIIAAQFVQSDGKTPITLAEWGYGYYTLKGLKTLYASQAPIYKMTTSNGKTTYSQIGPDDITFATASSVKPGIGSSKENGRYYVYPKLIDRPNTVWALGNAEDTPSTSYATANSTLQKLAPAKIWNSGYTYYFADINHLGAQGSPGYNGVVRNHIYEIEISGIKGLGTPVYDPNEVIYPEIPDEDESMVAMEIRVLLWRIVTKSIRLEW